MTEYRNPTPTVDIIIELEQGERVVLIERKNPPLGWALPGGFVDEGERVERAAVREALEETRLRVELTELAVCLLGSGPRPAPAHHEHGLHRPRLGHPRGGRRRRHRGHLRPRRAARDAVL